MKVQPPYEEQSEMGKNSAHTEVHAGATAQDEAYLKPVTAMTVAEVNAANRSRWEPRAQTQQNDCSCVKDK